MTAKRPGSGAENPENDTLFTGLPRILKPNEVAAALGVALRTLELWRQTGDGPLFLKLGPKLIRYREEDVATFLSGTIRASTSAQ